MSVGVAARVQHRRVMILKAGHKAGDITRSQDDDKVLFVKHDENAVWIYRQFACDHSHESMGIIDVSWHAF